MAEYWKNICVQNASLTAILLTSMVASKWPQRTNETSDMKSVTFITLVAMSILPLYMHFGGFRGQHGQGSLHTASNVTFYFLY